jgi:hypothetical protein
LKSEFHRHLVARHSLLGASTEEIAAKVRCTARAVRYLISTPEFAAIFAELQRERLKHLDRQVNALLFGAVKALDKMLKSPDWRARDAAVEKILKMHGRYVDKLSISGTVEHRARPGDDDDEADRLNEEIALDDLSPDQRTRILGAQDHLRAAQREYLAATRSLRQPPGRRPFHDGPDQPESPPTYAR